MSFPDVNLEKMNLAAIFAVEVLETGTLPVVIGRSGK